LSPPPRLLALAAALAAPAAGCSCPDPIGYVQDFEGCTGTCGAQVEGPGKATIVSTILPGEHGLELDGDVTVTLSPAAPLTIDTTYTLTLVAKHPESLTVALTIASPGAMPMSAPVGLAVEEVSPTSGDLADFTGVDYLPLLGTIDLSGAASATVSAITLQVKAGATSVIDLVKLVTVPPCPSR
jgi:hypothetical protein